MLKQLVDRFTTLPLIGIDIGSSMLKVAELARTEDRILLRRCAVAPVEGEEVAVSLKRLLNRAGITLSQAAIGLASPEVTVKSFQFPPMPKKELANAIQLEAEQEMLNGHSRSEIAIDWHLLSSESEESLRGVLAAVPRSILQNRLQAARKAGLRPAVVDVEGLALWNAYWTLAGSRENSSKTILLINIGANTTNLVIAKGPDELILIRDFQLGAGAFAQGEGKEWITEVRDSLGYARSQGGLRTLEGVYVTGGGVSPHVKPLIESAVSLAATFWNPLSDLERAPGARSIEEEAGPLLAIAIGLALRRPT